MCNSMIPILKSYTSKPLQSLRRPSVFDLSRWRRPERPDSQGKQKGTKRHSASTTHDEECGPEQREGSQNERTLQRSVKTPPYINLSQKSFTEIYTQTLQEGPDLVRNQFKIRYLNGTKRNKDPEKSPNKTHIYNNFFFRPPLL